MSPVKNGTPDRKAILTTPQACRLLKVTRQTLYAWMQSGMLKPWMKVGGASWLFAKPDVEKLKAQRYKR